MIALSEIDGIGIIAAASAVAGTALWFLLRDGKPANLKNVSSLPGPPAQLVLGNLRDMMDPSIHLKLTQWACEYGGMLRLSMLGQPIVVITDAALAAPLITRGPSELPKYSMAYDPANQLGTRNKQRGIFTEPGGPAHTWLRKALAPAFSTDNMRAAFPSVRSKADELVGVLAKLGAGNVEVDVTMSINACVLDIVGRVMFDMEFGALKDPENSAFLQVMERALAEISARVTDPFRETVQALLPFLPSSRKVAADMEELYKMYSTVMHDLQSRGPPAEGDTRMHALLRKLSTESTHPVTGKAVTDDQLQGNISAFLVGGFETSANTIMWFLHALVTHPEVAAKLEAELVAAGLVTRDDKPGREVEWGDLSGLRYFNLVLRETMRRHHIAGSTGTFRVMHKGMQVGETWLPKGTPVWIPLYAVANSPTNFVEPCRFWPERWEAGAKPEGSTGTATPSGHVRALGDRSALPFSDGTRSCIGQSLALMQTSTILLTLLRHLNFAPGSDPQATEAQQVMRLTVHSAAGFKFHVRMRGATSA